MENSPRREALVAELQQTRAKLAKVTHSINEAYAKKHGYAPGANVSGKQYSIWNRERSALILKVTNIESLIKRPKREKSFANAFVDAAKEILSQEDFQKVEAAAKEEVGC